MSKRTIEIGALCDPISKQIGDLISANAAEMLDADNDAITRCYLLGYMSESTTARARSRLLQKCQKAVDAHSAQKTTPLSVSSSASVPSVSSP